MKDIRTADIRGQRVLLRVDYNVPIKDGIVTDDSRIRASLPTLRYLLDGGASIIIISHLGRPSGQGYERKYSLVPVAEALEKLIGREVSLAPHVIGKHTNVDVTTMRSGDILMLENLRFDSRETEGVFDFAYAFEKLADIYVNDAFSASHRAHTSIYHVPMIMPCYAGLLFQKEVQTMDKLLRGPRPPFCVVLGGAKVSDKLPVLDKLVKSADSVIVGSGMCYPFLKAMDYPIPIPATPIETSVVQAAETILDKARIYRVKFWLPTDFVAAPEMSDEVDSDVYHRSDSRLPRLMGLDIGPATIRLFHQAITTARTIFWNGPMGVFEIDQFAEGTRQIAHAIADNRLAQSIVGGGDTIAAINKFDVSDQITDILYSGGAALEYLAGKNLPGLTALDFNQGVCV